MKIRYNDICRNCLIQADYHTCGVFKGPSAEEAILKDIWYNQLILGPNKCNKFIPKDNLKYLEMIYEEKEYEITL